MNVSRILLAALVVSTGILTSAVGSTLALSIPSVRDLHTSLNSALRADYSKDSIARLLKPLDARIIDEARRDNNRLDDEGDDQASGEIVKAFVTNKHRGPPPPAGPPGPSASPKHVIKGKPKVTSTPRPVATTLATQSPTATALPTPLPTSLPLPSPTVLPTPTPTPACSAPNPVTGFVRSITPPDGSTVPLTTKFVVKFNQPMEPRTVNTANIYLDNDISPWVFVVVTYNSQTFEATVTPTTPLLPGVTYTLGIWKGIKNVCGTRQEVTITATFKAAL